MNRKIRNAIFLVAVFLGSFSVWYSPVIFKGQAPYRMSELIPIAKNIYKTGKFSLEDNKNIYLSSSQIKDKGEIATVGNKFTAYLYAWLFKFTGLLTPGQLVVVSIIINSISLIIFSFVVLRLFGMKTSALFSLIYILMPFNWLQVYSIGVYEFAVLFLSLFFTFFLLGRDKKNEVAYFFVSGIFLSLSALARETFFLLIPITLVYLWFSGKRKIFLYFSVAICLVVSIFYLPNFFNKNSGNEYVKFFSSKEAQGESRRFSDFTFYGHIFPDPYTYHFQRQEFLKNFQEKTKQAGLLESLENKKVLVNMGEKGLSLTERFSLGFILFFTHIFRFTSLELAGGSFVFILSLLGLAGLKNKDKDLYRFVLFWTIGTIFLLSFVVVVGRDHLNDFNWVMSLLVAIGSLFTIELFSEKIASVKFSKLVFFFILAASLFYHLLTVNHIVFGKIYDTVTSPKIELYAEKIKAFNVNDSDVIAIGLTSKEQVVLNYLADKNTVVFSPGTVKKLIESKELEESFKKFGVRYFMGYEDGLSSKIEKETQVISIANSSIVASDNQTSSWKSLFMNLVK